MKIQNKISLLFTLLTGIILIAFCVLLYLFASRNVHENFYHMLEVRSDIAAHTELQQDTSITEIYNALKNKHLKNLPAESHKKFFGPTDERVIETARQAGMPLSFLDEAVKKGKSRYYSTDTFYVGTYVRHSNGNILLVSSAVDESGFAELMSLKKTIYIGFFIAIAVTFSIGKLFAMTIFKPVREIIKNVNGIKASNLHLRLEQGNGKDEISDLIVTFNNMLNRLETTFQLQNNFVSNASHELKTPLTIISGEAQLALRDKQSCSRSVQQSLQKIINESERLEHLMNSLLSLAQTGFDGKKLPLENIRIDELLLTVKLTANKIFPDNSITIDYDNLPDNDEKLWLVGNPTTLKVAMLNIVINACKYSDNKKVIVKIHIEKQNIVVSVIDEGIGIPEDELSKIFIPFFRASNTENYKGYGIGLPLSLNIIKRHGGKIEATSTINRGTTVQVFLPFAKQSLIKF